MKVTFVDFTEESSSISVKSTFDTSIIEIDLIKWQEKGKILVQA